MEAEGGEEEGGVEGVNPGLFLSLNIFEGEGVRACAPARVAAS